MRTMTPGAVRRRETTETVRDRMANLFVTAHRAEFPAAVAEAGSPGPAPPEVADSLPPPEPEVELEYDSGIDPDPDSAGPDSGLGPDPDPAPDTEPAAVRRGGRGLLSHPALMLDRRAVLGLSVLLLLAVGYAVQHFWLGRPQPVPIPVSTVATAATVGAGPTVARGGEGPPGSAASAAPSGEPVVVDVAGKVQHPGLRSLPGGSRVADALRAAGGPLPDVATDGLNLARVLADGEQILVGAPGGQSATGEVGPRGPLSLNHATLEQLDALPGVGPALAQRIVQFRQAHGGFRSLDQLRQVSGIGLRKFAELRSLVIL